MGFLDRAKKLAQQAKEKAEGAVAARKKDDQSPDGEPRAPAGEVQYGTPYVEGMLGRPGWRERGLEDPAAVLPIKVRDKVGVPRSTKSAVVEEPFGMGRRWSSGERSAGLFYALYPEHEQWEPEGGRKPLAEAAGATTATLPDGRTLLFVTLDQKRAVVELRGIDPAEHASLARTVAENLAPE